MATHALQSRAAVGTAPVTACGVSLRVKHQPETAGRETTAERTAMERRPTGDGSMQLA